MLTRYVLLYTLSAILPYVLSSDVITLTDANFHEEIEKMDLALVKFYAPWCGHCKKLAPEFVNAAKKFKADDTAASLVDVDCTTESKVCSEFGVQGYPTLKIFKNGVASEYNGGRTAADIVKVMAGQAGPASNEIKDLAMAEKLMNARSNLVVGFFKDDKADGFAVFTKAANELRETNKFAHTFCPKIAEKCGRNIGEIVLFRPKLMKSKFEEQQVLYNKEKYTIGLIRNFVKDNGAGLAPVIAPDAAQNYGYPQIVAIYNVDYDKDPKGTQYWRNRVMLVAEKYAEKHGIKFAVGGKDVWDGFLNEVGLDTDKKSPHVVAFDSSDAKFIMTKEFDPKGVAFTEFLEDYVGGKLTKHVKSEESPDNSQNANKILTANNFEEIIDGTKDAFLEFYAPWCGHCKSLAPKWEEMAEKLADDENIVIGKMDATANDVPSKFEVSGFPTLYWLPKGKDSKPVKYQSGREVDAMINFIKENASAGDVKVKDEL